MMDFLSAENLKDSQIDHNTSPLAFARLAEVARVARLQDFKKKRPWGFKYFSDIIVFKEEEVGFQADEEEEELLPPKKKKRSNKDHLLVIPNSAPLLPENVKQHIVEKMGGCDLHLVIQKPLFDSDVKSQLSRFSIPLSQVQSRGGLGFLTKTEAADLDAGKSMEVCLLEPPMKQTFLSLRKWLMGKSAIYALTTLWNSVVEKNGLKAREIVQLWSFRVESTLCFALVKVPTH